MKLSLFQIEQLCLEAIDLGFSSKLYQSYNSVMAYGALHVLAYQTANPGAIENPENETLSSAFDSLDKSLLPENFDVLKEFFDRAEAQILQEFYSIRSSINEIKGFDDAELLKTLDQMKELQKTESEAIGKLKELI